MLKLGEYTFVPEFIFGLKQTRGFGSESYIIQVAVIAYPDCATDHHALRLRHACDFLLYAGVDLFPETGDTAHEVGVYLLDCVLNHTRVIVDCNRHTPIQAEEAPGFLQDMAHREERHADIGVVDGRQQLLVHTHCGVVVGVGDADALRFPGCAGCVDKGRHVLRERAGGALLHLMTGLLVGLHAESDEVVPCHGDGVVVSYRDAVIFEDDDVAEFIRVSLPVVVGKRILMLIPDEDYFRTAVVDDIIELLL